MERTPGLAYATSLVSYFTEDPRQVVGGWIPWGIDRDALWVANVASTCTALMRRSLVEEVGGYDEWLTAFEDWDVFCLLAERGHTGTVIPEFLFHYRLRPDSMTRTSVVRDRYALLAYLYQKHPTLARHADRSLRILQGEAHKAQEELRRTASAAPRPLLHQLADQVNAGLKQLDFMHPLLRRAASLVLSDKADPRPLRDQVLDHLRRGPRPRS
jgi:hypothetical protein